MAEVDSLQRKSRAGTVGRFLGYVKKRRVPVGNNLHLTASQVNARPVVQPALISPAPFFNGDQGGNGPNLAPDGVYYGLFDGIGHLDIARVPVFASKYDQRAWQEQGFVSDNLDMRAGASIIQGRQTPQYERANINFTQAVPYGSQFEYQALPYGYV